MQPSDARRRPPGPDPPRRPAPFPPAPHHPPGPRPPARGGAFARRAGPAPGRPGAVGLAAPTDVEVAGGAGRGRGRGAQSNASGRYEPLARVAFDDGWQSFEELPPFKTTVTL